MRLFLYLPVYIARAYDGATCLLSACLPCVPAGVFTQNAANLQLDPVFKHVPAIYDISSDVRIVLESLEKRKERAVGHL